MNYSNLNDVEFEYLCKDVMSRKLSLNLQRFARGRDGGIDLTDDADKRNIIVQVKHYVKTNVSGLIRDLQKEASKVKHLCPKRYYVCCSKSLSPNNKQKIFQLFSPYMESTDCIITELELDEFLSESENTDILRKHFKLWLDSTNILTDILSNDVFLDSEVLLSGIEEEVKRFVQTLAYEEAIQCLSKRNVLLLLGNPGVGKSITSKMLVLHYSSLGYNVRYTTDVSDLKALKKSVSQSPKVKEIILLDDCFGQAYYNMKETQENELLALVKYINLNSNKLLIMNSRISIYREAGNRTSILRESFERKEYNAFILDVDGISTEDKAKIFYNHLYFSDIPKEYFENIKYNHNYRRIVKHSNYNPRIIENICSPWNYSQVGSNQYADYVIKHLDNPEWIWKNEFEIRLAKEDRLFLMILYSLSDTMITLNIAKECYNHYLISREPNLDLSLNHFNRVLYRLTDSMVKIVDNHGIKMLSVANPSVNDFLRKYLSENTPAKEDLISGSISIRQLQRLLSHDDYEKEIAKLFGNHSILKFVFENDSQKNGFIATWCVDHKIYNLIYKSYIQEFLINLHPVNLYEQKRISVSDILYGLLQSDFIKFYDLESILCDLNKLKKVLKELPLEELIKVINQIDSLFKSSSRSLYIDEVTSILQQSVNDYCCNVSADSYYYDLSSIIEDSTFENEDGKFIDYEEATAMLENEIEEEVRAELKHFSSSLPEDFCFDMSSTRIIVNGAEEIVMSYDQESDDYFPEWNNRNDNDSILDDIFNREFRY